MAALAASYGLEHADEFAWEVAHHPDERERRVLAVAATIGRADATVLKRSRRDEAAGDSRPCRWCGGELDGGFVVHELRQRGRRSVDR